MTAKPPPILVAAAAALATLACASTQMPSAAETAAVLRPGRVMVAPLNLGLRVPTELSGIDEPVWHELLRYVQAEDRRVSAIPRADAELAWADAIAELEQSGEASGLRTASAHFARQLREQADYDLLLMPSLVLRSALVRGSRASWDGVRRGLRVRQAPMNGAVIESHPPGASPEIWGLRGRVSAVSLHVALLTSDGRFVYEGLGGLDLVDEATHDRRTPSEAWQLERRSEPFDDLGHLRHGIALAFERRVVTTAPSR
jgi:hypothetical protein